MTALLEAGYDLAALSGIYVAIALLAIAAFLVAKIASVLDFSIFGTHPFAGLARALDNYVVDGAHAAIKSLDKTAVKFQSGLIDSLGLLIGVPLALALGVKEALAYLWTAALRPFVQSLVNPVRIVANSAAAHVGSLAAELGDKFLAAERFADARATGAFNDANLYTAAQVHRVREELTAALEAKFAQAQRAITTAKVDAFNHADIAVSQLQSALQQSLAKAEATVQTAVNVEAATRDRAVQAVRTEAERLVSDARTAADRAVQRAEANALAAVNQLGGTLERSIRDAENLAAAQVDAVSRQLARDESLTAQQVAQGMAEAQAAAGELVRRARDAASEQVAALRTTTETGIRQARDLATAQVNAAQARAEELVHEAQTQEAAAVRTVQVAVDQSLEAVRSVAVGALDDVRTIEGQFGALGTAGLIASIPLIASLVHTMATDTGLDRAECRGKVRGICGVDPNAWAGLLAGLAAIGLAFDLRALIAAAEEVAQPAIALVRQAS